MPKKKKKIIAKSFIHYLNERFGKNCNSSDWTFADAEDYIDANKLSAVVIMFDAKKKKQFGSVDFVVKNLKNAISPEVSYLFKTASDYINSELAGPQQGEQIN